MRLNLLQFNPKSIDHDVEYVIHNDESDDKSSNYPINDKNKAEYDNIDGPVYAIAPVRAYDISKNGEADDVRIDWLVGDGTAKYYNLNGKTNYELSDENGSVTDYDDKGEASDDRKIEFSDDENGFDDPGESHNDDDNDESAESHNSDVEDYEDDEDNEDEENESKNEDETKKPDIDDESNDPDASDDDDVSNVFDVADDCHGFDDSDSPDDSYDED